MRNDNKRLDGNSTDLLKLRGMEPGSEQLILTKQQSLNEEK
jgi:hypothetical protein